MNLLIISNNPNGGSFRDRIGAYLDIMRARGITHAVEVPNRFLVKRIRQYRHMDRYDVVLLHKKSLSLFDATFFKPARAKVIFNYDDAILFNNKGIATRTHVQRFRRSLRAADVVLVGSSYLAQLAAPYHDNIRILPLGLHTTKYGRDAKQQDGKIRLVWVGRPVTLGYIELLRPVIRELAGQYPNLVLRLVCEEFLDIEGVAIEKIRWTPKMRYRALAEADIGLAPLPDNPFTRGKCTFKVLEYSASGLPVVASPVGTNVDHVKDGITGYLAATPDQWMEKLRSLLDNPALRNDMGAKGREYAREFDNAIIGERLCDLLLETAGGSA
jgi:glycosyltransferase involved in cell wall biosynthesis